MKNRVNTEKKTGCSDQGKEEKNEKRNSIYVEFEMKVRWYKWIGSTGAKTGVRIWE